MPERFAKGAGFCLATREIGMLVVLKKELRKPNGEFVIPGLRKLRAIKMAATKDRPGINPFTKEAITIKGKPAQKNVKATALKALKDLIQ